MIKSEIRQGEGECLDFKQTINSVKKIAKTLVAFANTKGGKLLVGVKDNGSVVGANVEEERYMLEGAADVECKPPVIIRFTEENVDGKSILVAYVPESDQKPHYAKGDDLRWWAYIRVKDQCLLASKVMLDVMRSETKGIPSEIQFGQSEKLLFQYLETHDQISIKEFCKIASINRWKANKILVNLVRMNIVKVLSHEKHEFFTL